MKTRLRKMHFLALLLVAILFVSGCAPVTKEGQVRKLLEDEGFTVKNVDANSDKFLVVMDAKGSLEMQVVAALRFAHGVYPDAMKYEVKLLRDRETCFYEVDKEDMDIYVTALSGEYSNEEFVEVYSKLLGSIDESCI